MSIRITGMFSGLDTESIISELVSAQSVKKNSLVKAQTKLSWKQDAWKALNTKIYDFYTNTLSDMRYQGSYMKKTTKVSNTNAINVITSDSAVDGVRSVKVDQLAKGSRLTSGSLNTKSGVHFSGAANLSQLLKHRGEEVLGSGSGSASVSGSFRVVGAQGQYVDFDVNENTTIDDIVSMIKETGLNANFDQDNQRIFISSKNTGAVNNFNLVANDEGGLNALALFGLLSAGDIKRDDYDPADKETWTETQIWANYATDLDAYDKLIADEIKTRQEAYRTENKQLNSANEALAKNNDELKDANTKFFDDMDDTDYLASEFSAKFGELFSGYVDKLYGDNGLYDEMQAAKEWLDQVKDDTTLTDADKQHVQENYDNKKAAYEEAKKKVTDFMNDIAYGPLVEKKDENGDVVYEKVQKVDADGNPMFNQVEKKDENGDVVKDDEGNIVYENGDPIYEDKAVMVREGGLNKKYEDAVKAGTVDDALKAQVDSVNKWFNAVTSLEKNKSAIVSNEAKIAANEAKIADNDTYLDTTVDVSTGKTKLETAIREEFDARVKASSDAVAALNDPDKKGMFTASKIDAQDAEILIDGAKFTSMTNTFNVNGLTLTVQETTDKEVTMTTSTDTDGIYNMIKNFFSEYNKLINEMDSLYNAESSAGYEPLLSEEKEALTDSEVEEWEKKIKDSLLRRDSTLSSVSFSMASVLLRGAEVNGKQMYLSDFGINTLGYFKSAENERNAYHIDGDPDDASTKANEDKLKALIASDPDTVMNFFTKLSTNLYDDLTKKMAGTTLSSAMTVYNDKQMKSEYKDYTDKIKKQEDKLNAMTDKWYKKFSQMEVAMSKLESRSSSLASILGG